jgi:hypothetical protein
MRGAKGGFDVAAHDDIERFDAAGGDGRRITIARARLGSAASSVCCRNTRPLPKGRLNAEPLPLADQDRSIHHGRHFPDIPRPAVTSQQPHVVF